MPLPFARWLAGILVAAVIPAVLPAQPQVSVAPTNRLTIEDTLAWRMAASPVISPDGRRVAYLVGESNFETARVVTRLWWVDTETRQTRRVTHSDASVTSPRWSPDGRFLAFLSARNSAEGEPKPQVWLLPADGGEAHPLTHTEEGVLHFRWAPDGKAIYYVTQETLPPAERARREQQKKEKRDDVVVDRERPRREIWRAPLDGASAARIFAGDPGLDSFEPSPDGRWLVYRTNLTGDPDHDARHNLWLLDLGSRAARQLTRRAGMEHSPVWSPDSIRIAFLAPRVAEIDYSQDEVFVVAVTSAGDPPAPQQITRDFVGQMERLHWPARGSGIYFAAAVHTASRMFLLDSTNGRAQPVSPEAGYVTAADCTADANVCAVLMEGVDALPDIGVLHPAPAAADIRKLTDLNPQLKTFQLGAQEVIRWRAKDGLEIEGVLVKPPGWQPGTRYPLLLDIHGGPFGHRSNTLTTGNYPQLWAARGWLVLQPNFRGSAAYGHEFGIANRGDIGGKDYEDILAGVDYVIAQGLADPKRMAVMGESYGGYMTNWIVSQTQRFQAAISNFGIFSLITDFSNSVYPSWETGYLKDFYWDNLQIYLDRSPMKYVKQIRTPLLITHGLDDTNTFIANSKELYQALKLQGKKTKFVQFPREGHGFVEPQHIAAQFHHMAAWLDEHVPSAEESRAIIASETVRSGPWELRVTALRLPETYAGVAAKGRFVEVEILVRAVEPAAERFSLLVFDNAGGEVWLSSAGRAVYPEGIVAETLGQRVLVKSQSQVVAAIPDRDGNHSALAVALAFDAPADAREVVLHLKDFPLLRITLPVAQK